MHKLIARLSLITTLTCCLIGLPSQAVDDGQAFRDWTARCSVPPNSNAQVCVLEQIVFSDDGERPMLRAAAGFLEQPGGVFEPAILTTVPLMVALQPGLAVSVDGGDAFIADFHHCTPEGCVAGLPLDERVMGAFRRGADAEIRVATIDGATVSMTLSLRGFSAGFDALPKL
ncbi:MAG: invasion associated locus B family protein [Pseudomonadota bacterium]